MRALTQGHVVTVHTRYSEFVALAARLAAEAPAHAAALPALPPRHAGLWHRYHPQFLARRRRALQAWLQHTLLDVRWGGTAVYKDYVLGR